MVEVSVSKDDSLWTTIFTKAKVECKGSNIMKRFLNIIFTVVILLILLTGSLYTYIEWYRRRCEPEKANAIIVLGAAVWRNGPSPTLLERITLAENLYRHGYAHVIITTGGVGSFNPTPEGRAARNELIARGIPADAVYEEICSKNTRENLKGAQKIMEKHGWRRAIIVTHDFHLFRAITEAKKLGMDVTGAGVHETAMVRTPMVLREVIANLVSMAGF
jgi:uncharacterized SAM-binding protein YcdF (DUF218 family)